MDFNSRRIILVSLALAALTGACAEPPEADSLLAELGPTTLERVVIARMYQRDGWVVSAVDPEIDRAGAAQYVCDAIAPLHPTYVSGLVRLSHDDVISEEQVDMFRRVRRCIESRRDERRTPRPVRFDVVLNALDYADGTPDEDRCDPGGPTRLSADELTQRLRQRRRSIEDQLHPDGYFFDFFSMPWTNDDARDGGPFRSRVLEDEFPRMHRDHLFVGGNVWGGHVPPGSDFVAITDKSGREGVIDQAERLRAQGVPVLLHIRNDPHVEGSGGRLWSERDRTYRMRTLRRHVRWAEAAGASYMMPVFFPLMPNPDARGEWCTRRRPWIAYDANRDGAMLDRMADYFGRGERSAHLRSASGEDALPSGFDLEDDGPVLVHRAANYGAGQHLFSSSLLEIEDAAALTMEVEGYFGLARAGAPGTAALHRCDLGHGEHLLTTATGCEGVAGAVDEGTMGFVFTSAVDGAVPLHRLYRPGADGLAPDHFYTISAAERDGAAVYGYHSEGIVGYVWDESGLASDEVAPAPAPAPTPAPTPAPVTAPALTVIYRGVNGRTGQHLYTMNLGEIAGAPALTLESEVFGLATDAIEGTVPWYRCYLGNGWHLQTPSASCEGAGGAINEGVLGHIATTQLTGTVPLHRLFKGGTRNDHFYTADDFAYAYALAIGYSDEGIAGYVYPGR